MPGYKFMTNHVEVSEQGQVNTVISGWLLAFLGTGVVPIQTRIILKGLVTPGRAIPILPQLLQIVINVS